MKKLGILCLVLVMALGTVGIGYAAWTEDLLISGTVETGTIDAKWDTLTAFDSEPSDKNYSNVNASAVGDRMTVAVTNAYPSITYTVNWSIVGGGSVPIDVVAPAINRGTLPTSATLTFTGPEGTPIAWPVQLHPNGTLLGQLTIHLASDTAQDADYTFSIDLDYGQWNLP